MKRLLLFIFFMVLMFSCSNEVPTEKVSILNSVDDAVTLFNDAADSKIIRVQIFNKGKVPGKVPEKAPIVKKIVEKAAEPEEVVKKPITTDNTKKKDPKKKDAKKIEAKAKPIKKVTIKKIPLRVPVKKPKKD